MSESSSGLSSSTVWSWRRETPLGRFLRTESGSAAVLLAAAVAALLWANVSRGSYEAFWGTTFGVRVGGSGVSMHLGEWVNSGLMTFFFFVVGLEARRELDIGELRERRRVLLPVTAGVDVLEPGEIAPYGDEVKFLLVLLLVAGDGLAVGAGHRELDQSALARLGGVGLQVKGVAVLGDHQAAGDLGCVGRFGRVTVCCVRVGFRALTSHVSSGGVASGRGADGSDGVADHVGGAEDSGEPDDECADGGRGVHAIW